MTPTYLPAYLSTAMDADKTPSVSAELAAPASFLMAKRILKRSLRSLDTELFKAVPRLGGKRLLTCLQLIQILAECTIGLGGNEVRHALVVEKTRSALN
jgi:hypothetical protein